MDETSRLVPGYQCTFACRKKNYFINWRIGFYNLDFLKDLQVKYTISLKYTWL